MPRIVKHRMVSKQCPKCAQQCPVACKACQCGHIFFIARRAISIHKSGDANVDEATGEIKRRRTERIKRERPDFYNALEIESQLKKLHRKARTHKSSSSTSTSVAEGDGDVSNSDEPPRRRRGRPRIRPVTERPIEPADPEEEIFANISAANALQYSVILAEINRKMMVTQFKV